jgi:hypothetical protein
VRPGRGAAPRRGARKLVAVYPVDVNAHCGERIDLLVERLVSGAETAHTVGAKRPCKNVARV